MKAVVAAFNQEKALVGAFSVITNLRMELFQALVDIHLAGGGHPLPQAEVDDDPGEDEEAEQLQPDAAHVLHPARHLQHAVAADTKMLEKYSYNKKIINMKNIS